MIGDDPPRRCEILSQIGERVQVRIYDGQFGHIGNLSKTEILNDAVQRLPPGLRDFQTNGDLVFAGCVKLETHYELDAISCGDVITPMWGYRRGD